MRCERRAAHQEASDERPADRDRASVVTITGAEQPQLRLVGRWLERAGFETGTWAEVHAGAGLIVIEARGHLSDSGAREARARTRKRLRK
jgi:Toxin SymE, type I toxin-antitoxin system